MPPVAAAAPAGDAVELIAGVELESGLGGEDIQGASGARLHNPGGVGRPRRPFAPEHEIVVVAAAELDLLIARRQKKA